MADILSAVGDALGLTKGAEGDRLLIESWKDIKRSGKSENTFAAFINPDEFTINYNVHVESTSASAPGEQSRFGSILGTDPMDISLKFYLDGTGSSGKSCDVSEQIQKFYEVVGYHEEKHSTRFLRIFWGNLTLLRSNQYALDCVLKNASLQYKLFKPNGTPLRVIITATFTEAMSIELAESELPKSSPDLTHIRIVKEGDTLPALVNEIYGDFKYYLEVAKVNTLGSFLNLQPGQKLFFPPFDKNISKNNNG
ncbi:MAG: hypothetical protein WD426_12680 [Anditalea sp.]